MTQDIIQSITDAEAQAAQIKREAQEKAAQILADAQKNAQGIENSAVETCKAYAQEQNKKAVLDAEEEYASTMRAKEKDAKEYCETALKDADIFVQKIVGRVVGGNR